jgi:hypothetical protein
MEAGMSGETLGSMLAEAGTRGSQHLHNERQQIIDGVVDKLMPRLIVMHQESLEQQRAAMVDASREGFTRALLDNMTEDNARRMFKVGVDVLREEARIGAGNLVFGGLGTIAKWAFWPLLVLLGAWLIGGPILLKTVWAALTGGPR